MFIAFNIKEYNPFLNKIAKERKVDTSTAGLSTDHFATHVRAEFQQPANTSGFVRQDQWQNFIKPNYPERPGITNIRQKGDDIHIATYLGADCSGGDFTNSSGSYLIDEIKWP